MPPAVSYELRTADVFSVQARKCGILRKMGKSPTNQEVLCFMPRIKVFKKYCSVALVRIATRAAQFAKRDLTLDASLFYLYQLLVFEPQGWTKNTVTLGVAEMIAFVYTAFVFQWRGWRFSHLRPWVLTF